MFERSETWMKIFNELISDNGYNEMGKINYYKLTTMIEDLHNKIDYMEEKLKNKTD
jgi:hypothetical protein